jgi:phenylacetate-CoA ligase
MNPVIRMDPQERRQFQLERLQSTLNRAFRSVHFHQKRFEAAGFDPAEIERLEDLKRIGFTHRRDLGEHYPYGLFAVPLRDIVRIHTASGTTLKPAVSGYTRQDLQVWREIVARALEAGGVSPIDILQITLDPGLSNWGRDYKEGAEAVGASVIPYTPLSLEKQVMVLRDYKTSVLITTPASAGQLAMYLHNTGVQPMVLGLKRLILVGEPMAPGLRSELEDRLHVETWQHYGLSEVPGPAIGFECSRHAGLHVNEDHFLPEIVDPLSGDVLPEGETGELVLTTLTTRAFPLIRFRTGDRARFIPDGCACGVTLRRIEWLAERTDEMLSIRGVKVSPDQVRATVQAALGRLPQRCRFFRRVQDTRHWLEVWIGIDDTLFSDEIKELQRVIRTVGTRLEESLGVPVAVRIREGRSFAADPEDQGSDQV